MKNKTCGAVNTELGQSQYIVTFMFNKSTDKPLNYHQMITERWIEKFIQHLFRENSLFLFPWMFPEWQHIDCNTNGIFRTFPNNGISPRISANLNIVINSPTNIDKLIWWSP